MKKSMLVALAVTVLLAAVAVPALAAPSAAGGPGGRGQFTLAGTITAIDGTAVTVRVVSGNPVVHPYLGQNVTLQTTAATRFLLKTPDGTVVITLADLAVGQNVSAQGTLANDVWTASRITVGAQIIHWR